MMPGGKRLMAATGISMMKPETSFFYEIVKTAVDKRYLFRHCLKNPLKKPDFIKETFSGKK